MLNEELVDVEGLTKEVRKLRFAISKFKEYDEERKNHYASLETEIGVLKSELDEARYYMDLFKNEDKKIAEILTLKERTKRQKTEIAKLNNLVYLEKQGGIKLLDEATQEEIEALVLMRKHEFGIKDLKEIASFKTKNKKLEERLKQSKDTINSLLQQLNQLRAEKDSAPGD